MKYFPHPPLSCLFLEKRFYFGNCFVQLIVREFWILSSLDPLLSPLHVIILHRVLVIIQAAPFCLFFNPALLLFPLHSPNLSLQQFSTGLSTLQADSITFSFQKVCSGLGLLLLTMEDVVCLIQHNDVIQNPELQKPYMEMGN